MKSIVSHARFNSEKQQAQARRTSLPACTPRRRPWLPSTTQARLSCSQDQTLCAPLPPCETDPISPLPNLWPAGTARIGSPALPCRRRPPPPSPSPSPSAARSAAALASPGRAAPPSSQPPGASLPARVSAFSTGLCRQVAPAASWQRLQQQLIKPGLLGGESTGIIGIVVWTCAK